MSSDEIAIRVQNLSKCYTLYDAPRDRLKQFVLPRLCKVLGVESPSYYRNFWALRDVNFEVVRGESFGILGKNGAGKSTLLQLICGTVPPSSGEIEAHGRISALLELGAGFNPEFTGRENVILNASVIGITDVCESEKLDNILAFADIGPYIDQPLKTYSSGMVMRLAFSTAIVFEPQILIIDEALAVGDGLFQAKCIRRMEKLRENNTTILFVSHSMNAVNQLCERALVLDRGRQVFVGTALDTTQVYNKLLFGRTGVEAGSTSESEATPASPVNANGPLPAFADDTTKNGQCFVPTPDSYFVERYYEAHRSTESCGAITYLSLRAATSVGNYFVAGERIWLQQHVRFFRDTTDVIAGFMITTPLGVDCYHTNLLCREEPIATCYAGGEWVFEYQMTLDLCPGDYVIVFDCQYDLGGTPKIVDICYEAFYFRISSPRLVFDGGIADLSATISARLSSHREGGRKR